ncbi:DNA replication terminus site-binding protein [Serratia fonticola]|uniref:DNA replication terminus site-binding protein n=1 Tax=Serratia fonticola TaxID=47917 RepID=A0A4U9UAD6_SERFO|nr:DNA replication terminus site-binding protein [Serratia fonticola]
MSLCTPTCTFDHSQRLSLHHPAHQPGLGTFWLGQQAHHQEGEARRYILAQLEKSQKAGRAVPPYNREQWAELVGREIDDVSRLPQNATLKSNGR